MSEQGFSDFKTFCQTKILDCDLVETSLARVYPPSFLEWSASKNCAKIALDIHFLGMKLFKYFLFKKINFENQKKIGEKLLCEIESWKTGEELCKQILESRNVYESNGWSLCLNDEKTSCELMGLDHVLDLIARKEIVPTFPTGESFFLENIQTPSTPK